LLDEEDTENASIHEAADPVIPEKTRNSCWEENTHAKDDQDVVAVLPDHNRVLIEIRDISTADTLGILLHNHPANVGVEKAFSDAIWILGGIGVAVMSTMISAPPSDGALYSTGTT
jgi:hypothetical protein